MAAVDAKLLTRLGVPLRWTKDDESTEDLTGAIDESVEIFGNHEDFAYRGKTVTAKSSVLSGFTKGETVQALDSDGNVTGKVYRLQRTIEDDGGMVTIEVVT